MDDGHWEDIYAHRSDQEVSWFEPDPAISRQLVADVLAGEDGCVIDVGGGTSRLVDHLLHDLGLDCVAVLDISPTALARTSERLGEDTGRVEWIAADITTVDDLQPFDVWHDRAVFHFLIEPEDRARYIDLAARTIPNGGHAIIATFGPNGPEQCSGLPVERYDAAKLAEEFGPRFAATAAIEVEHPKPQGGTQSFLYSTLERT